MLVKIFEGGLPGAVEGMVWEDDGGFLMRHKRSPLGHDYTYLEFHLREGGPLMSSLLVEWRQVWEGRSWGGSNRQPRWILFHRFPSGQQDDRHWGIVHLGGGGFCRRFWWMYMGVIV
jgi:hypothetical protein